MEILIDTVNQLISIPVDKVEKARNLLTELIQSKKMTVLKLQQITGLLNFLARAIYPGRVFTRRLYVKYSYQGLKQHYHINVDNEMREDCEVWLKFLEMNNAVCRPFIDFTTYLTADVLNFYTDASGAEDKGFGCVFNEDWTFVMWEDNFIANFKPSIELLELYGSSDCNRALG